MSVVARRKESAEYSDGSQDNDNRNDSANELGGEIGYESNSDLSERENGDGSQDPEKKVDDDEDRSNPQYIPKRGTFYEHDDRTALSGDESTTTGGSESKTSSAAGAGGGGAGDEKPEEKKKPRRSDAHKWSHDKYNENDQTPKSRDELVSIYGYDIRNEDAPPHARRNKRYGRGPNKYTRTWEDEEAYKRQQVANTKKQPQQLPKDEDFPELDKSGRTRVSVKKSPVQPSRRTIQKDQSKENQENNNNLGSGRRSNNKQHGNIIEKLNIENLTITTTTNPNSNVSQRKVNTAQQKPVPTPQHVVSKQDVRTSTQQSNDVQQQRPTTNVKQQSCNIVSNNKSTQQQQIIAQQQQQLIQQQVRQERQGGAVTAHHSDKTAQGAQQNISAGVSSSVKRYSSLRQRPLAESYSPQTQHPPPPAPPQQQQQQQHRYVPEFQPTTAPSQAQHQGSPIPQIHQQQQIIHQHLTMLAEQQMVNPHAHMHQHNQMQPQLQPGPTAAPYNTQAAMIQAQYMQGGNNTVYAQPPPVYAQPTPPPPPPPYATHQIYHNYTGGSGMTYYNPSDQETRVPPPTRRSRPTAAIPIVPPPNTNVKSTGSTTTDKENIDRIVDNMFVRKQRPAAHAPSTTSTDKSDKSESRSSQEPQSKESSQPNSMTSSTISNTQEHTTDTVPSTAMVVEETTPTVDQAESLKVALEVEKSIDANVPFPTEA